MTDDESDLAEQIASRMLAVMHDELERATNGRPTDAATALTVALAITIVAIDPVSPAAELARVQTLLPEIVARVHARGVLVLDAARPRVH